MVFWSHILETKALESLLGSIANVGDKENQKKFINEMLKKIYLAEKPYIEGKRKIERRMTICMDEDRYSNCTIVAIESIIILQDLSRKYLTIVGIVGYTSSISPVMQSKLEFDYQTEHPHNLALLVYKTLDQRDYIGKPISFHNFIENARWVV